MNIRDIWARIGNSVRWRNCWVSSLEAGLASRGWGGRQRGCAQHVPPRPVAWLCWSTGLLFPGAVCPQCPATPVSWQISVPSLSSAGMCQKKGGGEGRENHWRAKSCFNPTNKNTVQCIVAGPHKTLPCVGDATPAQQLSGIGYSSL